MNQKKKKNLIDFMNNEFKRILRKNEFWPFT